MKFSVVTSVYHNDRPEFIIRALNSITSEQTRKPDEIVLVVDGPIPEDISRILHEFSSKNSNLFNIIWLPENKGLGNALRVGVESAKHEIVARMDSDDVSTPDRFEKQISYMEDHPECDVVGSQITEFIGDESNVVGKRCVPCENETILKWLKGRCPFNHVSVTMLRSRVIAVGNYMDWHFNEDYYLWVRMAMSGYRFANLPDTLVNVRVGKEMYRRRGGWRYFQSEAQLQKYMLDHKLISMPRYLYNVAIRWLVQVAMPNRLRGWVFRNFARQ